MSYEIITSMSINQKQRKVSLSLYSSNVFPKKAERIILQKDNQDDFEKLLSNIFIDTIGGVYRFNSANQYKWTYVFDQMQKTILNILYHDDNPDNIRDWYKVICDFIDQHPSFVFDRLCVDDKKIINSIDKNKYVLLSQVDNAIYFAKRDNIYAIDLNRLNDFLSWNDISNADIQGMNYYRASLLQNRYPNAILVKYTDLNREKISNYINTSVSA